MARTDAFITSRNLCVSDVQKINYIVKCRAKRYIAAGEREWLYPEKAVNCTWGELKGVLLPPENGMFHFGGEMFVGYKDGSTYYQDAFGRTNPDSEFLQKVKPVKKQRRNSLCRCGSGKKYKKCCLNKREEEKSTSAVLSIRERNLAFINCVTDVLGLNDGKTWDDVRKELSGDQIKEIYRFYGHLWPKDTDYISLLPKPDGTLRALYTGIVDPQAITLTITSMTLYCDEILVVSPFVNPALMNPEFSPLENPHQYKHDTLKNIMLLLMLEPYIKKGYINLIPDLFVANPYLGRQAMSMAEERLKDTEVNEEQSSQLRMLMEADAKRAYQMMPDTYHRQSILETYPDMPEERVVALIEHVHQTRAEDPLTLLQDNVYSAGGGQLMKTNLTPNFEYSLLIAQITGSFILSDSPHRKMEILASCAIDDVQLDIASLISSKDFLLNINCSAAFRVRKSGKLGEIRSVLRETLIAAKGSKGKVVTSKYMKGLEARYDKAHTIAQREMSSIDDALGCDGESFDQQNIQCKLSCIIPIQGFSDKNVQRLLISWGSTIHLSSVPMAIFVDRSEKS
ncbi:MAG: SEC-C domain-containing protein [Pseudomonadales bacterium]|nr:SEC-C domain-containing protein [Pseudomonadales bacterium]